ncbi:MAG: ATP-grasp fold amidoligase family protein, partial [Candidatus Rokuibacteriota bacterium]
MKETLARLVRGLARRGRRILSDSIPDRVVLTRRFERTFGRPLNLRSPQTFNEKLYWLMLYYRPPLMSQLADKYAVRRYVAERVGPHILNDLYGVWDCAADIDFAKLPEAFVLKVNWGWRMNLFCPDKSAL